MARWRAAAFISSVVAIAAAAACSSFESAVETPPDSDSGADSDSTDSSVDAGADATRGPARIHVYGGYSNNAGTVTADDAWSADLLPDGGLGTWLPAPHLAMSRFFAANAITATGRLVAAGGAYAALDASADVQAQTSSVDTASVDPPMKVAASTPLPFVVASAAGVAAGPWVFVTGGLSGTTITRNEVFVSSFDGNGALLPWRSTAPLPASTAAHDVVAFGDLLFVAGGGFFSGSEFVAVAETWRTKIGADGTVGAWSKTGSLLAPVAIHRLVAVKGRLYVIGGRAANGEATANVSVALPSSDGDVTWEASTPLPGPVSVACAVVANDRIYVLGGFPATNAAPHAKIYVGLVGDSGGIVWSETTAGLPTGRAAHGCAAF